MIREFQLSIPQPCSQQWHSFVPTDKGAFCGSCAKEVIDFTKLSDEQVIAYFQKQSSRTCGKFRPDQLKIYSLIPARPSRRWPWVTVVAMSVMLFFTSRETTAQRVCRKPKTTEQYPSYKTGEAFLENVSAVRITGKVTDKHGNDMPGVNVLRKGTTQGTTTDAKGMYTFVMTDLTLSNTFVFSFVGYTSAEYQAYWNSDTCTLNVCMMEDLMVLGGAEITTNRISPRRWWWQLKGLFE